MEVQFIITLSQTDWSPRSVNCRPLSALLKDTASCPEEAGHYVGKIKAGLQKGKHAHPSHVVKLTALHTRCEYILSACSVRNGSYANVLLRTLKKINVVYSHDGQFP